MRIISKVDHPYCKQVVKKVFQKINTDFNEIVIEDYDGDRIYLYNDGIEYIIRLWNIIALVPDKQNQTCQICISYTLFLMVEDDDGGHGDEIISGSLKIKCKE